MQDSVKKKNSGGRRKGAGRPPKKEAKEYVVRITAAEKKMIEDGRKPVENEQ